MPLSTGNYPADGVNQDFHWLVPDWPAPPRIRALSTLRHGGVSREPFDSLNLADHVGDDTAAVAINRERLMTAAGLPSMPLVAPLIGRPTRAIRPNRVRYVPY